MIGGVLAGFAALGYTRSNETLGCKPSPMEIAGTPTNMSVHVPLFNKAHNP
ncbi:hypothetical protein ACE6H2_026299 [Prunus campanulata]